MDSQEVMTVVERIQSAITTVEEARGVPLSASCVVHRGELLEILDQARASFPMDLAHAQEIIAARESILEEARLTADQLIVHAREEVAQMVDRPRLLRLQEQNLEGSSMRLKRMLRSNAKRLRRISTLAWPHLKSF